MDLRRSVLIVDRSDEARELLRAVLEPRGMHVWEAAAAAEGLAMARRHHPDVIVLDSDLGCEKADEVAAAFAHEAATQPTRLLVLGSARRAGPAQGEFISKPYHYAPLIRKIEALLASISSAGGAKAA